MTAIVAALLAPGAAARGVPAKAEKKPPKTKRPVDLFMGEYAGTFTPAKGKAVSAEAKVVPDGGGRYRVVLITPPVREGPTRTRVQVPGKAEGDRLTFAGKPGKVEWTGSIAERKLTAEGKGRGGGRYELKLTVRKSPTEGAKPPPGAVVLLPATKGQPPLDGWTNSKWKALPGGVMQITRGGNNSVRKFGDVKLHVEFRIPYEPTRRGQGRGNSGVYLMGRYEVQVLDSFGLVPRKGDCGAIYGVAVPSVNACLPPLRWQTYDVTFRAPRTGADGKPATPGSMTVLHNGIKIHKDVKLKGTTRGGARGGAQTGPLHLQDHGHPVQYRNIWVVELKPEPNKK
jgi:hypothetical protein